MCDAYSMAALTGLSLGTQVHAQQQQAKAQADNLNYQRTIALRNEEAATQNEYNQSQKGNREEMQQRLRTAALIAQQRAALGASGIDIGSGTALDVQAGSAEMAYTDLLEMRENSLARQKQYRQQAVDFKNKASLLETQVKNVKIASNLQTLTTVLSAATSYASMGMQNDWFSSSGGGASPQPIASSGGFSSRGIY